MRGDWWYLMVFMEHVQGSFDQYLIWHHMHWLNFNFFLFEWRVQEEWRLYLRWENKYIPVVNCRFIATSTANGSTWCFLSCRAHCYASRMKQIPNSRSDCIHCTQFALSIQRWDEMQIRTTSLKSRQMHFVMCFVNAFLCRWCAL